MAGCDIELAEFGWPEPLFVSPMPRDDLDCAEDVLFKGLEEGLQHVAGLAFGSPNYVAGVMVGHDREVAVPLAEADLVDPDAAQVGESIWVEQLIDEALGDLADRHPRDPEQLADCGLIRPLSHQANRVFERPCEVAVVASPRHSLCDRRIALSTKEAPNESRDPNRATPSAEVPPAAQAPRSVPRSRHSTVWAFHPVSSRSRVQHKVVVLELETSDPEASEV